MQARINSAASAAITIAPVESGRSPLLFFACAVSVFACVSFARASCGVVDAGTLVAGVAPGAGEAGVAPGVAGGVVAAAVLAAGVVAVTGGMYVVVGDDVAVAPGALEPPVAAAAPLVPRVSTANAIKVVRTMTGMLTTCWRA
jgi:hypothetical protein